MAVSPDVLLSAFNPPPIAVDPGAEARIGWLATASGNALLVALAGAPVVVVVDLDLANDEVAIGGPDAAGVRRLFRGVNNADGAGTNTLEVTDAGSTGLVGRVAITPAGIMGAIAARDLRKTLILQNTGIRPIDVFLTAAAPGAFGTGFLIPVPPGGQLDPLPLNYRGAIGAIVPAGANGELTFAEVIGG